MPILNNTMLNPNSVIPINGAIYMILWSKHNESNLFNRICAGRKLTNAKGIKIVRMTCIHLSYIEIGYLINSKNESFIKRIASVRIIQKAGILKRINKDEWISIPLTIIIINNMMLKIFTVIFSLFIQYISAMSEIIILPA